MRSVIAEGSALKGQEILNTVAAHLLKQAAKSLGPVASYDGGETCAYRSPEGLRCAVGGALEEGEYSPAMESKTVEDLGDLLPERLRPHRALLTSLQLIHDTHPVASWPRQLRELSESLGLEVPEGCQ